MTKAAFRPIGILNETSDFEGYLRELNLELSLDTDFSSGTSALAQPFQLDADTVIGNRFCTLPLEGADAEPGGGPSELTIRRWQRFGESGAKLIWGGEAVAVHPDGRSNPHQLMLTQQTLPGFIHLRQELVEHHVDKSGSDEGLLVGLQLSHAGRFACPHSIDQPEPVILHHHPDLDNLLSISSDFPVLSDEQIMEIRDCYIHSAILAEEAGFDFVDIQHSNGLLGHEFLSAWDRPGLYGGTMEHRTRFLREICAGIREHSPNLKIGVRMSLFDIPPYKADPESGIGWPQLLEHAQGAMFGGNPDDPTAFDLTEPIQFLEELERLEIRMINLTAGCSYYNYHLSYPASYPPVGAYQAPMDPLFQVAQHIRATAEVKKRFPNMMVVGSGYSYLQEWLPGVAHFNVRTGMTDFVGLGRCLLSYPDFPADVLSGERLDRQRICRTFCDCISAPAMGLVSGCYPLDRHYMRLPDSRILRGKKREFRQSLSGS